MVFFSPPSFHLHIVSKLSKLPMNDFISNNKTKKKILILKKILTPVLEDPQTFRSLPVSTGCWERGQTDVPSCAELPGYVPSDPATLATPLNQESLLKALGRLGGRKPNHL